MVYSPLSVVEEQPKDTTVHYIPRVNRSAAPEKSYMRTTIATDVKSKSAARSRSKRSSIRAKSEYVYKEGEEDEYDDNDSEHLFKIDKSLLTNRVNISMH